MTNKDLKKIRTILGLQAENRFLKHFNFVMFTCCIFLLLLLTQSCQSKQRTVGTSSENHTNTTVTTLLKDTVIYVHFPVQLPVTVFIPLQDTVSSDTVFAENTTAKAFSFVQNGKLNLVLQAKDTVIPVHVPNAIRETTTTHSTQSKQTTTVEQKSKRRFGSTLVERVLILVGFVCLILLGFFITPKRCVR